MLVYWRVSLPTQLRQVLLTVKHMQTDGKIFLRIHKSATMGDVRAKIMEVLDLPRSAFGPPRGEVGLLTTRPVVVRELDDFFFVISGDDR